MYLYLPIQTPHPRPSMTKNGTLQAITSKAYMYKWTEDHKAQVVLVVVGSACSRLASGSLIPIYKCLASIETLPFDAFLRIYRRFAPRQVRESGQVSLRSSGQYCAIRRSAVRFDSRIICRRHRFEEYSSSRSTVVDLGTPPKVYYAVATWRWQLAIQLHTLYLS